MEPVRRFFQAGPEDSFPWKIVRISIALVFLYAGAAKVADPQEFTLAIDHYRLTPWPVTVGLAFYLPWLEIGLGGCLLTRRMLPGASVLSFAASGVFLGVILSAWSRNLDISCGCFGPAINHTHYPSHVAFNLLLLASTGARAGYDLFRKSNPET